MMAEAKRYTGHGELDVHLYRPQNISDDGQEEEEEIRPQLHVKDVYTSGSEAGSFKAPRRRSKKPKLESSDEDASSSASSAGDDKHDATSNAESDAEENEDHAASKAISGNEDDAASAASASEDDAAKSDADDEYDTDEDDSHKKETSEEYFTNKRYKSHRHRWLVGFYEYLARPSAGNKKDNIRLQHASQMRMLLEFIDPNGDDITCLTEDQGDAVWKRWVRPMLDGKNKKPGTVVSYLTSYEKFLTYVTNERYSRFGPPLHEDFKKVFTIVLSEIKGWRSTVDSQTQDVQNQRYLDETEGLLTAEELIQLKSSRPFTEAEKIVRQAEAGKELSQKEFTNARDMLIARFAIDAATRPGPLNNATLADYEAAEVYDGVKVMLVAKHKRAKDGPAILPMLPDLQQFMDTYVHKIRPKFANKDEAKLFVTIEGKGFKEGTIGRRLSNICEKAGLRLGDRFAHVDMRKLVTTKTKEQATPEEAALVRRVMAHSKITAERSYVRSNLTKLGAKAVKVIARVTLAGEETKKEKKEKKEEPQSEEEQDVQSDQESHEIAAPNPVDAPSSPQAGPSGVSLQSSCSVSLLSSAKIIPPTPDKHLTDKQKEAIARLFHTEIERGQKITLEKAQSKCCTTAVLSVLTTSKKRVKQVVNHVNYLIDKRPNPTLKDLPAETPAKVDTWLDDFDDPSSRSSGTRESWSEADTKAMQRKFRNYDSLPSTATIRQLCQSDDQLYTILNREGWRRTYTKIKNLFKKKARE